MEGCVIPGSFDPVTLGHLDVIERASALFPKVHVLVAENKEKKYLFSVQERVEMVRAATADLPGVVVDATDGLLVDALEKLGVWTVVRGVRSYEDFEFEMQVSRAYRQMDGRTEVLLLPSLPKYSHITSSMVRQIGAFGAELTGWVPECIAGRVLKRLYPGRGEQASPGK